MGYRNTMCGLIKLQPNVEPCLTLNLPSVTTLFQHLEALLGATLDQFSSTLLYLVLKLSLPF